MLPGRDGLQFRRESNNIVRFRMNYDGASGNGVLTVCQRYIGAPAQLLPESISSGRRSLS
jgi:hypothetical protein